LRSNQVVWTQENLLVFNLKILAYIFLQYVLSNSGTISLIAKFGPITL
jgi:hypothetical protein